MIEQLNKCKHSHSLALTTQLKNLRQACSRTFLFQGFKAWLVALVPVGEGGKGFPGQKGRDYLTSLGRSREIQDRSETWDF